MQSCRRHRLRLVVWSFAGMLLATLFVILPSCRSQSGQGKRTDTELKPGWPQPNRTFKQVSLSEIRAEVPTVPGAEYVNDDELCMQCHKTYVETFQHNVHRGIHKGQSCEACHGPASKHLETRGREPGLILNFKKMSPAQSSEACMKCHEQNACSPGSQWRTSKHAHANLSCISCHTAHYNVPPGTPATTGLGEVTQTQRPDPRGMPNANVASAPRIAPDSQIKFVNFEQPPDIETLRANSNNLGAVAPDTCLRCHGEMKSLLEIAGPHQIGGANDFNCTTCHNPHGNIVEHSRKDLCLSCHKQDSPTMAWHASTHNLAGVACTDCHNPHPHAGVQKFITTSGVDLENSHLSRQKRRPMSVQEPEACYKCHQNIFAQTHLPSHHPIREGKMVCSDCHDAHGQLEGNLKAESKNLLCWKCHADKQGPFAYEHPPVTEDCGICHEPHGTVTNNLLKQPATFLCLRCHVGHRDGDHGGGARLNIDTLPQLRKGLYTDCTTCHSQIHGSDLPSPHFPAMLR